MVLPQRTAPLTREETNHLARQVVQKPIKSSSRKRYKQHEIEYHAMLLEAGVNPDCPDFSGTRDENKDPITIACSLILKKCGPKELHFRELNAVSSGGAVKSAVVSYWRKKGFSDNHQSYPDGSFSGNPGTCKDLQTLIKALDAAQREKRINQTNRAYQQTHEDLRSLYFAFIEPNLVRAVNRDRDVPYADLQAAIINLLQFTSVSRGAEMLELRVSDIRFTGDSVDCPIVAVLPATKTQTNRDTYFRWERGPDLSMCGLSALLGWLCVLRSHEVHHSYLFMAVTSNYLQGGKKLDSSSYRTALQRMGNVVHVSNLTEHSARRGGIGYQYFVLRKDLFFLFRAFSWDSLSEMLKYIGAEDHTNSYAVLGFTAFGTCELGPVMQPAVALPVQASTTRAEPERAPVHPRPEVSRPVAAGTISAPQPASIAPPPVILRAPPPHPILAPGAYAQPHPLSFASHLYRPPAPASSDPGQSHPNAVPAVPPYWQSNSFYPSGVWPAEATWHTGPWNGADQGAPGTTN